jgi:hypothetical protein
MKKKMGDKYERKETWHKRMIFCKDFIIVIL